MFLQKSSLSFFFNLINAAIGYISLFFVSRYLGPNALGALAASLSFVNIFAILGNLGFDIAHVQKISEGEDYNKAMGVFATVKVVTTLFMVVVIALAYEVYPLLFGKPYLPAELRPFFYIVLAASFLNNFSKVFSVTFTGTTEVVKNWLGLFTQRASNVALNVFVAVAGFSFFYLSYSYLASIVVSLLVYAILAKRFSFSFDRELFLKYRKIAIPLAFVSFFDIAFQNIDKIMLTSFLSIQEVGYYSGAQSIVNMTNYVDVVLSALLIPLYAPLFKAGDTAGVIAKANKIERYLAILLIPVGSFIMFFSVEITALMLGNKFHTSSIVLTFLSFAVLLNIFSRPYTSQIIAAQRFKVAAKLSMFNLGVYVASFIIMVPQSIGGVPMLGLGLHGAVLSTLCSSLLTTSMFRYYAYKFSGGKPGYIVLLLLIPGVVAFGGLKLLVAPLLTKKLLIIPAFAIGTALFFLIGFAVKIISKDDLRYLYRFVNVKELMRYARREVKS